MERYRRTRTRNTNIEDKVGFKVKVARQSIVCIGIIIVLSIVSVLKTDTAVKLNERIEYTLSYTVDYKATVVEIMNKINKFIKGEQNDAEITDQAHKN